MDDLSNKQYSTFDYTSRYIGVPFYFNNRDQKYIMGIGQNLKKTTSWTSYEVKPTDTLDYLALKFYNNPTYWWIIAYFNDIQDAFIKLSDKFTLLKIPYIGSIEFGDMR